MSLLRWVLALLFTSLVLADAVAPITPRATARMGRRKVKKPPVLTKKDYSSFLCPGGSVACPVPPDPSEITPASIAALDSSLDSLAAWFKQGFECVELATELNSCGGCLAFGVGRDCTKIENARATGCEDSVCKVYTCFEGYSVAPDGQSCVKRS